MINDAINFFFSDKGVKDIFSSARFELDQREESSKYDIVGEIISLRYIFDRNLKAYALVTQETEKINTDLQIIYIHTLHEYLIKNIALYYTRLQTIFENHIEVEGYDDYDKYINELKKKKDPDKDQIFGLTYMYDNTFFEIAERLFLDEIKIRPFLSGGISFIYENKLDERAYIPNINLLCSYNGPIDSAKYFFNELLLMLNSFDSFYKIFKSKTPIEYDPMLKGLIESCKYFKFNGIEKIIEYSKTFADIDFISE